MDFRRKYMIDKLLELLCYIDVPNVTLVDTEGKYIAHGTMEETAHNTYAIFSHDDGHVVNNYNRYHVESISISVETLSAEIAVKYRKGGKDVENSR